MGKCFSRLKAKPALQSTNESTTKSRRWKRNVKTAFCMGKNSAVVEPCEIRDNVTKTETEQKHSAVEIFTIEDIVTKTEAEQKHSAVELFATEDIVTKTEAEQKHSAVELFAIEDIVTKTEAEQKHSAAELFATEDIVTKTEAEQKHSTVVEPSTIQDTDTKSVSEHKYSGEPCVIKESVPKSEKEHSQDSQMLAFDTLHRVAWNLDLPSLAFSPDYIYKLSFPQPASDYMAFREKVDRCSISLENVILRDYIVLGTIKVKNICFEKRVFVRVTFDSWVTSQDVEAKYVQPYGGNLVHDYDTFSFEFEIDTHSDTYKKVHFAVCFETPAGQYWDNNSGADYELIPYENRGCKVDKYF